MYCCVCFEEGEGLETVDFELVLFDNANLGQELTHVVPLIALQLNNLAVLGMLYDCAIASKVFLERSDQFLFVKLFADTLHGGQRLAAVSLLYANVNVTAADHLARLFL